MISFIVRMRFAQEDRKEVLEAGCISYIPHELTGDSSLVMIYEQYRDEAALEAHRASPHFHKYAIGGLFQWMKERSVEDLNALA